jgi:cytochrome c biogenesis protein CcdA
MPVETIIGLPMALSLGLMYGLGPCLVSCLPYLGPVFLARDFGLRHSWRVVLPLSLGRLTGYAGFGLVAGWAGHTLEDGASAPMLRLLVGSAAVMIGLALLWRRPACAKATTTTVSPLRRLDIGAKDVAGPLRAQRADQSPPTAGFAQPAGYGGAERCSAKPRLRPPRGGGREEEGSLVHSLLPGGLFLMGLSMTLTPCAPMGVVLFSAAAMASAGHGLLLGLTFGLGAIVVPSIVFGIGAAYLGRELRAQLGRWRSWLERLSAALLIFVGVSQLLR